MIPSILQDPQSRWRALVVVAVLVPATLVPPRAATGEPSQPSGFFFNTDITLTQNGGGTLTATYPAAPITSPDTERERFASAATELKDVQIQDGIVRATVSFTDISRISEARELSSITASRENTPEGLERVHARLRSPVLGNVITSQQATIRMTVPGPVVKSNAPEVAGTTVTWRAPVAQYFKEEGIELEVTYAPEPKSLAERPR
jgi:hypothetical protein